MSATIAAFVCVMYVACGLLVTCGVGGRESAPGPPATDTWLRKLFLLTGYAFVVSVWPLVLWIVLEKNAMERS